MTSTLARHSGASPVSRTASRSASAGVWRSSSSNELDHIPTVRERGDLPTGVGAPVLPAGGPRRVNEQLPQGRPHPLGVEEIGCCRLVQLVLVLDYQPAVGEDDEVELLVHHVYAERRPPAIPLEVHVP